MVFFSCFVLVGGGKMWVLGGIEEEGGMESAYIHGLVKAEAGTWYSRLISMLD
jgi:hypothetical protein